MTKHADARKALLTGASLASTSLMVVLGEHPPAAELPAPALILEPNHT